LLCHFHLGKCEIDPAPKGAFVVIASEARFDCSSQPVPWGFRKRALIPGYSAPTTMKEALHLLIVGRNDL
jgi:hypothetical protein